MSDRMEMSLKKKGIITSVVGAVLVVTFALVGWVAYPAIVDSLIDTEQVLVEGKLPWILWQKPRFPIRIKHFLFECINPEEVLAGAKPKVVQRGPYVFDEIREKNITGKSTDRVVYKETRQYFFNREASSGLELDDYIVTVNPIYMTIAKLLSVLDVSDLIMSTVNRIADAYLKQRNESAFMNHTVGELIYQGWPMEPDIDVINLIIEQFPDLGLKPLPEDLRFGLFSTKNNSQDGEFLVNTGESEQDKFALIERWNNKTYLDYWQGNESYCNRIAGTDGTVFPPKLDTSQRLYIFQTDLCRTVYGEFVDETDNDGIPANRYVVPEKVLSSKEEDPDNWCFCKDNRTCYGSGILDLSACYDGVPVLGSNPHFLGADDEYISAVEGVEPERQKHLTYFEIERLTSVLLYAAKRVQVNVDLRKYRLPSLAKVSDVIFPIAWYEETAEVDPETRDLLYTYLVVVMDAVEITRGVLLGLSVTVTVIGIFITIKASRRKPILV